MSHTQLKPYYWGIFENFFLLQNVHTQHCHLMIIRFMKVESCNKFILKSFSSQMLCSFAMYICTLIIVLHGRSKHCKIFMSMWKTRGQNVKPFQVWLWDTNKQRRNRSVGMYSKTNILLQTSRYGQWSMSKDKACFSSFSYGISESEWR